MPPIAIIILVVIALAIGAYFFTRKPAGPELPAKKEPEQLPSKKPSKELKSKPRAEENDDAEQERARAKAKGKPKAPAPTETVGETPVAKAATSERPPPRPERGKEIDEEFGRGTARDPSLLRRGLARTRGGMIARLADLVRGKKEIDPAVLQEIEEILLSSDVGVKTTQTLIERMHERLKNKELDDEEKVWAALRAEAQRILGDGGRMRLRAKPTVVMLVGVNGSGKTTTIGKLASKLKAQGKKVVLGAGDTFRAAAVAQLEVWGEREGATVVKGKEQADPGSVLFDAVTKAKELGADVVLCDTAGRLHTKSNLMEELARVRRSIVKALDGAPHETLLVLDATNGQNALEQAKQFQEAIELTGVVLTKLDGTAKGGVILAIAEELKLPVRYIGLGERSADLREFDPSEFIEALFSSRDSVSTEAA